MPELLGVRLENGKYPTPRLFFVQAAYWPEVPVPHWPYTVDILALIMLWPCRHSDSVQKRTML